MSGTIPKLKPRCPYLVIALSMLSLHVWAEYKAPDTMTQTEQHQISMAAMKYDQCSNNFALTQLETQSDPRVIADHAMKECAYILEETVASLTDSGYQPAVIQRLVNRISHRTANKLLSKLMIYMANPK